MMGPVEAMVIQAFGIGVRVEMLKEPRRAEEFVDLVYKARKADADFESAKLCTRCGSTYDETGACSNRPCQGGRGEWCLEHHGAPFAYGVSK